MDSLSRDLLDHIIERLEHIDEHVRKQSQTDQILERLDTIHNRLERQNQKQNTLDGKLSEVSNQLKQEKVFMRDQLQAAQNEILCRLTELHETGEETTEIHGPSGQKGLDVSMKTGGTGAETKLHSVNSSLDEFDKEDQRPVHDLIRAEFEKLTQSLKDTLNDNQQNVGREITRNTEIASKQLHDFREMTKIQLFAQTAGMDDKLDNITAANEDLRRQMLTCEEKLTTVEQTTQQHMKDGVMFGVNELRNSIDHINATNEDLRQELLTCEEKLTTVEQTTQQHVKDGVMFAVNELRNSAVTYLKSFFTKKTLVCLLLFSAVVLAVWYKSESLTSVKSQIIHHMDNTKAQLVSVTSDSTQHIMDKLDNMSASVKSQIIHQMDNTKAQPVSVNSDGIKHIMDKLDNMSARVKSQIIQQMDKTKAELVSVTSDSTQHIMDKLDTFAFSPWHLQYKETRNDQQNDSETVNGIHEAELLAKRMKTMMGFVKNEAENITKLLSTNQCVGKTSRMTDNITHTMLELKKEINKEMRNMSFYGPILSHFLFIGPVAFIFALGAVWDFLRKSRAAIPGLVLLAYVLLYFVSFLALWYLYANPTGVEPHIILEIENMTMTHGSINNNGTGNFTNPLLELASEVYKQMRNIAFYGPFISFSTSVVRILPFLFIAILDKDSKLSKHAGTFMSIVNSIFILLSIVVMLQAWVLTPVWVV